MTSNTVNTALSSLGWTEEEVMEDTQVWCLWNGKFDEDTRFVSLLSDGTYLLEADSLVEGYGDYVSVPEAQVVGHPFLA